MAKLTRVTGKVFGGDAPLSQIGQFGSALTGTPVNTQDVATIQALAAYLQGWGGGVITSRNFPPIEEVTGVLKTISYQACYLLQEGIPEYDTNTEYSNTSIVKSISGNELSFYISLQNNNVGNALTDTTYWTKAIFIGSSPIGVPQFTLNFNATLPENCIWLEGAKVLKSTYTKLAPIYGDEYAPSTATDTDTYLYLPDCRNRTIWGGTTAGYLSAGLPNITGSIDPWTAHSNASIGTRNGWGVMYSTGTGTIISRAETWGGQSLGIGFDASRSSSIYGASSTVQPPVLKVRVYTRYQ